MAPFRFFYRWTIWAPIAAWLMLGGAYALPPHPAFAWLMVVARGATVFAAVHHAEVMAHRVGEPFGTLVLAIAVTIIEVSLIVSVMLGRRHDHAGRRAHHHPAGRGAPVPLRDVRVSLDRALRPPRTIMRASQLSPRPA